MATPFSQLVGIQALLNVVTGRALLDDPRREPDVPRRAHGTPPAPLDPEVLDKALGSERGQAVPALDAPQPSLEGDPPAHGDTLSDEELILRFLMPDPDVDAMYAAGPVQQHLPVADTPAPRWWSS